MTEVPTADELTLAEALLAGLRGRRMLLEFVSQSSYLAGGNSADSFVSLLRRASHQLDPGAGRSRVTLRIGGSRSREHIPDDTTPEEVAAALDEVTLAEPTNELLRDCIAEACALAMYWHRHTAKTSWPRHLPWSRTRRSWQKNQRHLVVDARVASTNIVAAAFDGCPAGLWWVEDSLGWKHALATRFEFPTENLRVFEIDSAEAWAELCRRFPIDVTGLRYWNWHDTTGRTGDWVQPDWVAVAREYDAVRLQIAAYLSAAGTVIDVSEGAASVIAGWNPEQTWWLSDATSYGDEQLAWHRADDQSAAFGCERDQTES